MPSAASSFLLLPTLNIEPVGFVATKKMKLLSGNPDGFALVFELQSSTNKGNR
jgi:hypothetical protein